MQCQRTFDCECESCQERFEQAEVCSCCGARVGFGCGADTDEDRRAARGWSDEEQVAR